MIHPAARVEIVAPPVAVLELPPTIRFEVEKRQDNIQIVALPELDFTLEPFAVITTVPDTAQILTSDGEALTSGGETLTW